jgi:hypothetical protein
LTCRASRALRAAWGSVLITLVLAVLALSPEARTHNTRSAWPYRTLIARIAGKPVRLPNRRFRVDRDLVICNGEGRPIRRAGVPRWKHFTCTQTLFNRRGVSRDVSFRVHVVGAIRLLITDARYGPH